MATYATTVAQYLEGQFRPAGYEFESDGFRQGAIQRMLSQGLVVFVGGSGVWPLPEPNVQAASYTLVLDDAGKAVEMDVASANTVTVPPNSAVAFPVGTVVEVCQVGAGQTTVVAGSGVTIRTPATLILTGQWSTVSLRKRGTDDWLLAGDVEAAP